MTDPYREELCAHCGRATGYRLDLVGRGLTPCCGKFECETALKASDPPAVVSTCATCKFMGPNVDGVDAWDDELDDTLSSEHHVCHRILHGNGASNGVASRILSQPAIVTDGSGYAARLRVLPTFACNLHEPPP